MSQESRRASSRAQRASERGLQVAVVTSRKASEPLKSSAPHEEQGRHHRKRNMKKET